MTGLDAHAHDFAARYVFSRLGTVTSSAEYLPAIRPGAWHEAN